MYLLQMFKYFGLTQTSENLDQVDKSIQTLIENSYVSAEIISHFKAYANNVIGVNPNLFKPISLSGDLGLLIRRGSLTVNIGPFTVKKQQAKWRIKGNEKWQESGTTLRFLPVGDIEIEYSNVENWLVPPIPTIDIEDRVDKVVEATYIFNSPKGHLQISLTPNEVQGLGKWRLKGTDTWYESGYTLMNIMGGEYTIEFYDLLPWFEPPVTKVLVEPRVTNSHSFSYELIPTKGSLKVNILPQSAIDSEIKWRRKGTNLWLDSGYTELGVLSGNYLIEFSPSSDHYPMADKAVEVLVEQLQEVDVVFTLIPTKGTLKVTLQPNIINESLGGRWRRSGTTTWFRSEEVEQDVLQGTYGIEFLVIDQWDSPPVASVIIVPEQETAITCNYTYHPTRGDLTVNIGPSNIPAEAKWRIVGADSWRDNGSTIIDLEQGTYVIEFCEVPEWTKPDNTDVIIVPDEVKTLNIEYTWSPTVGSLQVNLLPTEVVAAGATWRLANTSLWRSSGYEEKNLPAGDYEVEVSNPNVDAFVAPPNVIAPIVNGYKSEITGKFGVIGEPDVMHEMLEVEIDSGLKGIKKRKAPFSITVTSLNEPGVVETNIKVIKYKMANSIAIIGGLVISTSTPNFIPSDPALTMTGMTISVSADLMQDASYTINASTWFMRVLAENYVSMKLGKIQRKDPILKVSTLPEISGTGCLKDFSFGNVKKKIAILTPPIPIVESSIGSPMLSTFGLGKIQRKNSIIIQ